MKTSFFSNLVLILASFFSLNIAAQNDNQATFETYLKKVYNAFSTDGFKTMKSYYTENATEIGPDGSLTLGLKALEAAWNQMEGIMDAKPQFSYKLTSWRLIKPDVALITWDSHDKFFLFGQTMESDNTGSALLRKEKGQWLIEFDQLTPKKPFPDQQVDIAAIKALGNEAYAAFAAHDAARFASCYTEDANLIGPFGDNLKGRKAIEQVHAELFKAWANMPPSKVEVTGMNIRFIAPDVAICDWSHKEIGEMNGKSVVQATTCVNACQRVNGKWLVAAMSLTPVQAAPPMPGN